MKISPEILEIVKLRGLGNTYYSHIFKHMKIVSADLSETTAQMTVEIPVISHWTDNDGNLSRQALIMLVDIIPLPICWTFNPNNMITISAHVSTFAKAKLGEVLTLNLYCADTVSKSYVTILVEVKAGRNIVATGSSSLKFVKGTHFREDKI